MTVEAALQILKKARVIDLTHPINETSPRFPALPALEKRDVFTLKDGFHVQEFRFVGQYGTHIDAPRHFVENGRWLDDIGLEELLLPLYVIDLSQEVAQNPNTELGVEDIVAFERRYGKIQEGAFVAFRSDWSKRWPNQEAMRNLNDLGQQETPGWSKEAIAFLVKERHVKALGHETLDTDSGQRAAQNGFLDNEYYLLEQGIYQIELMAHLDEVPPTGSIIAVSFPHFEKATGSPVRAVAYVDN
ncbi:cyclase family protein [Streptococcus sp. zg-JUN1979]|uniref:cyclase family protein n=1 Tax=Streptococcus sp. zg-JUN1979 TaxID=3391450 RepID=UPI0039A5A61C